MRHDFEKYLSMERHNHNFEGHSVRWGSFYLTCKSEGSDTKEEVSAVSANNIKNLNIRFSSGKELKDAVQRASIVSLETILGASK